MAASIDVRMIVVMAASMDVRMIVVVRILMGVIVSMIVRILIAMRMIVMVRILVGVIASMSMDMLMGVIVVVFMNVVLSKLAAVRMLKCILMCVVLLMAIGIGIRMTVPVGAPISMALFRTVYGHTYMGTQNTTGFFFLRYHRNTGNPQPIYRLQKVLRPGMQLQQSPHKHIPCSPHIAFQIQRFHDRSPLTYD